MRLLIAVMSGFAALFLSTQWITIDSYNPIKMTVFFIGTVTLLSVSIYNYMKHTGEIE
jgi:polyferredoxin